jgi:hypothetical protein
MKRPHLPGFIERNPRKSIVAGALVLALGSAELAGYLANPTEAVPQGACESPFATTRTYIDPNGSQWKTNAGVGEGVVIHVTLPKGAEGVVAGFRSPNAGATWNKSEMVPTTAGSVALKFAIGEGYVIFGAADVSQNPADCVAPPAISVTEYNASDYFDAPGQIAWPNRVNTVVNLLP